MLETDYIDDPERPGMMMPVTTVPNKVRSLIASGKLGPEDIIRICGDIPNSLYHR
jgi:TatD-related deoxyribonuclease